MRQNRPKFRVLYAKKFVKSTTPLDAGVGGDDLYELWSYAAYVAENFCENTNALSFYEF